MGAHALTDDVWGIELDKDATATQRRARQLAAGMACEQADITSLDPQDYYWPNDHLHLHASPPCQTFSAAGKGDGRKHLENLGSAAYDILLRGITYIDLSDVPEGSLLVLEPARWIHALRPDSISMEQVRSVLPIWESYAEGLEAIGYSTWTALLHSEQYGVPQTRTRAWLGASLHGPVEPPTPTHSKYHVRKPERLDANVLPWVSMAEALGRGMTKRPYVAIAAGTAKGGQDPEMLGGSGARATVAKAALDGDWVSTHIMQGGAGGEGRPRTVDHPAPTQSAKGTATVTNDPDNHWHGRENKAARVAAAEAPATTVQGDSRIWPRGHKINQADIDRLGEEEAKARYGDRAGSKARRVTVEEAGILQGFPADFPWQGSKTSQFRQVGNAVNPAVAEAVLRGLL